MKLGKLLLSERPMSVRAFTDDAAGLLARIKRLIDQGHIVTWAYDSAGDFTHTASSGQWKSKAWFRPQVKTDMLRMLIIKNNKIPFTREIFAVYHGRFVEMLISHVADKYTTASVSPGPVSGDEPSLEG